jgi:hypothetical protein
MALAAYRRFIGNEIEPAFLGSNGSPHERAGPRYLALVLPSSTRSPTGGDMNKPPKKHRLPRSPEAKRRPSDTKQAKQWLGEVADHLSNYPYAGPAYRFVASAIKRYLRGSKNLNVDRARSLLYSQLGLVEPAGRRQTFKERRVRRERGIMLERLKKQRDKKTPLYKLGHEVGLKDGRSAKAIHEERVMVKLQAALDRNIKQVLEE